MLCEKHLSNLETGRRVTCDEGTAKAHSLITVEVDIQGLSTEFFLKDLLDLGDTNATTEDLNLLNVFEGKTGLLESFFNWDCYPGEESGSGFFKFFAFNNSIQ